MTSRYEDLAKLAIRDSQNFYQEQEGCSDCAAMAISQLAEYLQAPADTVSFVKLGSDFRSTGEKSQRPDLRFSPDGAWHFGIKIYFRESQALNYGVVTLYLNIQSSGHGYKLTFDREFMVDNANPDSFNAFVDHVYTSLASDYGKNFRIRRPQIGFLAGA